MNRLKNKMKIVSVNAGLPHLGMRNGEQSRPESAKSQSRVGLS
jgi:hypothetical protein